MKIGQPSDTSNAIAQSSQPAIAKTNQEDTPARAERRAPPGASFTVSGFGRVERTRTGDAPEVDMDKVTAMREAIENKTFSVNAEAIADKLLANAREMLKRTTS